MKQLLPFNHLERILFGEKWQPFLSASPDQIALLVSVMTNIFPLLLQPPVSNPPTNLKAKHATNETHTPHYSKTLVVQYQYHLDDGILADTARTTDDEDHRLRRSRQRFRGERRALCPTPPPDPGEADPAMPDHITHTCTLALGLQTVERNIISFTENHRRGHYTEF